MVVQGVASWYDAADALLLSAGLFLLAFLTLVLVRSKRRGLMVLHTLVLAGLLQAIYGSLMMLSGTEWGFFAPKEFGRGLATGTFVNRNHYANLLVMSLAAGFGLLLAQMNLRGASNMRQRLRSFLQAALGPKARLRIFMVITVIALVLTRSRMGNASFFAALTFVGLFALWRLREPSRPLVVLVCHRFLGYVRYRRKWLAITRADRERTHDAPRETEWLLGKIVKINGRDHSVSLRERVRASIHWLVALTLAMRRKITVFISPT
jgi:hypothetical protein